MELHRKPDEHYLNGKDKWRVHYITWHNYRGNQDEYTEVIQLFRNAQLVGQTVWHKDSVGNTTKAYEEGLHRLPATVTEISTKN